MEIDKNRGSPEFQRLVYKATFMDHFTDVANYYLKYGPDNNLDAYGEHWYLWQRYDSIGFLLKKGVIDLSYLDDLLKSAVIAAWNKFEPVNVDLRNKYDLSPKVKGSGKPIVETPIHSMRLIGSMSSFSLGILNGSAGLYRSRHGS